VAIRPDGTLLAALYADGPRIGTFDGSVWEFEDGLAPISCNEGADCDVRLSAWRDGTAWVIFMDRDANQSTLWRRGTEGTWDQVALPDQLREGSPGAGPDGTLWLMQSPRTAYFDGAAWTVWYQADVPAFDIWVEEDGTPWALTGGWAVDPSLWVFREGTWSRLEPPLPDPGWPGATTSRDGAMWVAADSRVWSFDGATWTLRFEAGAMVSSLAPAPDGGMWVAAGDLWLIGDGLPVLVARDLDAWSLVPSPDGSVWALTGGGLYRIEG
jgi:hypothetical protein